MNPKAAIGRFSLMQLWVAATLLSILPLLIAVSYAAVSLQEKNKDHHRLLKQVDLVSSHSGALAEHVKELLRLSKQFTLLREPSFLQLYRQKLVAMQDDVDALRPILDDPDSQRLMDSLLETANTVRDTLYAGRNIDQTALSNSLQLLVALSADLTSQAANYRRRSLMQGEAEFNAIVNQVFLLAALALPGSLLLMIFAIYMVSRPLWRLSQAIQSLVEQNWEKTIAIQGPADLAALGDNLEWMRTQVVASRRQTTAFIQHITHDLKTPIAAVIEAGNLLHEEVPGPLTPRQHSVLAVLRTNTRNLEHLIQQLINYNAVSHGIVTQWEDVDIYALCQTIRARLEVSQPDKQALWAFQGYPRAVRSDARLIEMILKNLLGNAFQFIPEHGSITVRWGRDDHEWHLAVSDNGPGIHPAELPNIYKPFFKGATDSKPKVPSTGIGLSIVLECVNLLRGKIETCSQPGEGATFTVSFPLATQ